MQSSHHRNCSFFCFRRHLPIRRKVIFLGKSLQQLLTHPRDKSQFFIIYFINFGFFTFNTVECNIAVRMWLLSIQFHAPFLLASNSLVHAAEIFQRTGLIFQLLVETPRYFQRPVVFRSYQAPNDLKSTVFEAVNCRKLFFYCTSSQYP